MANRIAGQCLEPVVSIFGGRAKRVRPYRRLIAIVSIVLILLLGAPRDALLVAEVIPLQAEPQSKTDIPRTPEKKNVSSVSESSVGDTGGKRYRNIVLQLAAMSSEASATAIAESMHQKHLPAFVWHQTGDYFYRVLLGPYTDPQILAEAKDALKHADMKSH